MVAGRIGIFTRERMGDRFTDKIFAFDPACYRHRVVLQGYLVGRFLADNPFFSVNHYFDIADSRVDPEIRDPVDRLRANVAVGMNESPYRNITSVNFSISALSPSRRS